MSSESFFSKIARFFGFGKSSGSGRSGSGSGLLKLYVGNLSYDVNDDDLRKAFEPYGRVTSAQVVRDRQSDQSKGFGFVEMSSQSEINAAIRAMNGKELKGRAVNVNEARPRPEGSQGGNRGGFRGGRNRGGYRGRRGSGRTSSSQQMD